MSSAPVCRTCKWLKPDTARYLGKIERIERGVCTNPHFRVVDLVTGVEAFPKAKDVRNQTGHTCGLEGALWESESAYKLFIREVTWPTPLEVYFYLACFVILATAVGVICGAKI